MIYRNKSKPTGLEQLGELTNWALALAGSNKCFSIYTEHLQATKFPPPLIFSARRAKASNLMAGGWLVAPDGLCIRVVSHPSAGDLHGWPIVCNWQRETAMRRVVVIRKSPYWAEPTTAGVVMLDRLRLNAQLAVDELFEQKRILKLTIKEIEVLGADFPDYYRIKFADELGDMTLYWKEGQESFKTAVAEAIEREIRGED